MRTYREHQSQFREHYGDDPAPADRGTMGVTPLREASDVAMRSLAAPVSDALGMLRSGHMHRRTSAHRVRWDVVNLDVNGRRLRYRVTTEDDTASASATTWAMSLHGYFAGGSMYARESEILAARLGWRMVNPSLPGFGGSDCFAAGVVRIQDLADELRRIKDVLGIERMILIGHSMGAAVAMHYAANHPDDVLGVIYRDGVATPAWQHRHGALARVLSATMPDVAPVADMVAAVALDLPDLLAGQAFATIRSMIPDLRHNIRMFSRSAPVAAMLRHLDLSDEVRFVRAHGIPLLAEWGCFDRLIPPSTADEFAAVAGLDVHWLPGGHSWMLARPGGQAEVLLRMPWGRDFVSDVNERAATFATR